MNQTNFLDKNFEPGIQSRKKKKRLFIILLILLGIAAAVFILRSSFASSLKRSSITTAVAEQGNMQNTLNASGEVLPEFEEVITSPISASIQTVVLEAGSSVKTGQSILSLDKSSTQTEYERLKLAVASRQNDIQKLKLQLDKSFYDIQSSNSIKQLRISSLEAAIENAKRLYKAGGGTREDVEQAELNLKVAKLEKLQLENEIRNKQQTMQVEMREAGIALSVQQAAMRELERKLQLANVVSRRDGVITWVNKNIGAAVIEGEALAKIANLNSFKVQGSISDSYLDQLRNGMSALIRINEKQIKGTVINVQPAIQNGIVTFSVQLEEQERNNELLRPNLKVDVFLITDAKSNVLRVANGPAFKGTATQDIFVLQNDKAVRRTVHIGLTNFDFVEIKDNVKPGEVIITSDMSEYINLKEITLKN